MMQKLIDLIVQGETKPALVVCIPGLVSSSVRGIGARIYLVACVPMRYTITIASSSHSLRL